MILTFRAMDETAARAILAWRYEAPYTLYNPDPADLEADLAGLLDPANGYYSAHDAQGALVAFRCFGPDAQVPGGDYRAGALDTGGGLRPDLTGRGLGGAVLDAGLAFGRATFRPPAFRVTVAAFNARALRTCTRAGFVPVQTFQSPANGREFIVLLRPEEPPPTAAASP